jgi:hypothetical protein
MMLLPYSCRKDARQEGSAPAKEATKKRVIDAINMLAGSTEGTP